MWHKTGFLSEYPDRKRHFCICIYNRATYARCASLISRIEKDKHMEVTVVLSGALMEEEYGRAFQYIEVNHPKAKFKRILLDPVPPGPARHVHISGQIVHRLGEYLAEQTFDAIIVVADRFETLPTAMVAAYLNFPVIHLQGGEITGNIDERIRHAVTKLSDYHFVSTECAKMYLLRMGEEKERVHYTGCPSIDLVKQLRVSRWTPREKYILCIFHPHTEEIGEQYQQTKVVLQAVVEFCARYKHKCYWYWPNPDPGREEVIRLLEEAHKAEQDYLIKAVNTEPLGFLKQLAGASFLVGNSSVGLRESAYIGVPTINVGARQSLRERSWNVIDVPPQFEMIVEAMESQFSAHKYKKSFLFGRGEAANYIAAHLDRYEFSPKPPLGYPALVEYRSKHLGETRFIKHGKQQPTHSVKNIQRRSAQRRRVSRESGVS